MRVQDKATPATTDIGAQLADDVVDRTIIGDGYYAASGKLDNGDTVEMWMVSERGRGMLNTTDVVYIALNGICDGRRHGLDNATSDLAIWLRGRNLGRTDDGCEERLGVAGQRILDTLYSDFAR